MPAKSPKMYIDGKWVDSSSGKTFEDHNPFTGDVYANVPAGNAEDARSAIDAAKAAFPEWAATPPAAKRQIFLKAADVMESRQDELVQAMMEEVGGTIGISMFQMGFVPGLFRMAASRRLRRQRARSSPPTMPTPSSWPSVSQPVSWPASPLSTFHTSLGAARSPCRSPTGTRQC